MQLPVIRGVIERRILVNYRVDPRVLAEVLPQPFRPKLVHGVGIAGICLIGLKQMRPRYAPRFLGMKSENAAHRIAVEWDDEQGQVREGVYIPRRDTSSWLNAAVGGRLFPGVHHHARFRVDERDGRYSVVMDSDDGKTHVAVSGRACPELPSTTVFDTIADASKFFQCGLLGYSPSGGNRGFDGLKLRTFNWNMTPLAVETVESSMYDDRGRFPAECIAFDSALLMREIEHEWRAAAVIHGLHTSRSITRVRDAVGRWMTVPRST